MDSLLLSCLLSPYRHIVHIFMCTPGGVYSYLETSKKLSLGVLIGMNNALHFS